MHKLEFVEWGIRAHKTTKEKYIVLKAKLTSNATGEVSDISLPFKLNPNGSVPKTSRVFVPSSMIYCDHPYYDSDVTTTSSGFYSGKGGAYVQIERMSEKEYGSINPIWTLIFDVDELLIVTVYDDHHEHHYVKYIVPHTSVNRSSSTGTKKYKDFLKENNKNDVSKTKVDDTDNIKTTIISKKSNNDTIDDAKEPKFINPITYDENKKDVVFELTQPVITFGKMYDDVKVPSKRREDAGLDIYAYFNEDFKLITPHTTAIFNTGLVSHFSPEWFIKLEERGSTGTLGIGQRSGIIDSGYRGEWMVPLTNTTDKWIIIDKKTHTLDKEGRQYAKKYYASILGINEDMIILYPYNKAICQAIVYTNYDTTVVTDTLENVKSVPSERGSGKLGSSNK